MNLLLAVGGQLGLITPIGPTGSKLLDSFNMVHTHTGCRHSILLPPTLSHPSVNGQVSNINPPTSPTNTQNSDIMGNGDELATDHGMVNGVMTGEGNISNENEDVSTDVPLENNVEVKAPSMNDGDVDPPSLGTINKDGFEKPRCPMKKDVVAEGPASNIGTENIFIWLRYIPDDNDLENFQWSESSEFDDLPDRMVLCKLLHLTQSCLRSLYCHCLRRT